LNKIVLILVAILLVSCATRSPQTNALLKSHLDLPRKHQIADVPFVKQTDYLCAPSSLLMVLKSQGKEGTLEKLKSQMFTPKSQGTYRTDLVSSARRSGLLAVEIEGVEALLKEISQDHPVIVFQNVGLESYPTWHYAVVTGYDLRTPEIYLHSGEKAQKKENLKLFEETWSQGEYWGLVVLDPNKISVGSSEIKYAEGAAALENLSYLEEAKGAYLNMLKRWPKSLLARIGLGNIFFAQKAYSQSVKYLQAATVDHPESEVARHNLAVARKASQKGKRP
jgi:tetratricopeptide (TPR) repeat protein